MTFLKQLFLVMWHDRKTAPLRIVRKSFARYRRFGYQNMRRKLEREFYALYPGENREFLEQKLYKQWRRHHEPKLHVVPVPLEGPLFSIVLRIDRKNPKLWKASIRSILQQSYGRWELWILGISWLNRKKIRQLRERIGEESRIHWIDKSWDQLALKEQKNLLESMEGTYLVPLDASDKLGPYALTLFARDLVKAPSLRLLYGDQDRIDDRGRRVSPWFKTDWNPDLFLSHNYIGQGWCMEMQLFRELDGWKEGGELADYDLLLRATKRLNENQIRHIPQILYHQNVKNPSIFPGNREVVPKLLSQRIGKDSEIRVFPGLIPGTCKVEYALPPTPPKVTIIIPTRDGYKLLHRCIDSILIKTRYPNYEILVVDNQSSCQKTLKYMQSLEQQYKRIRVLRYDRAFNYSAINNYAARQANGEVLILLNNDVEVLSALWMTEMVQHALRPEIGAVGAKLYYDNLTIQHAGVILGFGGVGGHGHKYFPRESDGYFGRLKMIQNYSAVTGACLAVRKALYFEVRGLEEEHLTVAFNDVDFCLKLREKGYRNLWTPYAELYHHESRTRGIDDTPEKKARFDAEVAYMKRRWKKFLKKDPYYSPHLSLFFEDFRIETYWKQRRELWQ